jgi:hypothetical protein
MSTKLLGQHDVTYHEYLLSYSGIPSRWRTRAEPKCHVFANFPSENAIYICIRNREPGFRLWTGVIDPLGDPRGPLFHAVHRQATDTSNEVGHWETVCPPPPQFKIRLCQIPVFCIRILILMSIRCIATDKRRLSILMPQCYQHLLRT